MIYGNMQAELMETKRSGYIHMYGTPIVDDIVVYVSKLINNDSQILWGL